jgi:hypothetical protein
MPAVAAIPPGPNAARVWHDPIVSRAALMGGGVVRQLTNYRGHSHHVAGAAPCWLDRGRRLVLVSDREGCGNLFVYDFANASLTQLTDLRGKDRPTEVVGTTHDRLTFHYGASAYELDCTSLWLRPLAAKTSRHRAAAAPRSKLAVGETLAAGGRDRVIWIGSARTPLAKTEGSGRAPFASTAPSLSPDGRRVVFASDAGGYAQVYAVELPLK